MESVARQQDLAALRASIEAIEKRPPLAGSMAIPGARKAGTAAEEWAALLAAPGGLLHEVHTDEQRNGTAALGFALGLARGLLAPERPALLYLQLTHDGQDTGLPYGPGLAGFGIDPATLILGRMKTLLELLWATEEAIACRAVAAVIAEIAGAPRALDFTASRRLSLRAASNGASVFLLRHGREREASAARLRWHIAPASSQAPPDDDMAPGPARWRVVLEKGRLLSRALEGGSELLLDWTEDGFSPAIQHSGDDAGRRALPSPSAPGAAPAPLGHRLSQAG